MNKKDILDELLKHRYAHRGLHKKPAIPENSMAAFRLAVEKGYGMEMDLHLTRDGKLAVIHDASLLRTAGVDLVIEDLTLEEAQKYMLEESSEVIPDFQEVLDMTAGRVPLIVELKVGKIDFLADIRDSVIEKITIAMNVDALDDDTLLSLQCIIRECPGNSDLYFLIADSDGQTHLNMHSRSTKVSVKKNLISFIESKPALSYKIN